MLSTGKILIVDDEDRIRFFLREILASDGHDVTTAENGKQALEIISEQEFDLALLDLNLPDMNGMQISAELKEQWPETTVIILTAHASLETSIEALRQGTHDYLFKPCRASELRESIQNGLEKRKRVLEQRRMVGQLNQLTNMLQEIQDGAAGQPDIGEPDPDSKAEQKITETTAKIEDEQLLEYGALAVDKLRHVITYYGEPLELSSTEHRLLVYFVSHAPRVIPPQELMQNVLGYDSDFTEAGDVIRQHVHRIRRKLKSIAGDETHVIKTVRSVGYVLTK